MEEKELKNKVLGIFSSYFGIPKEDLYFELELERDLNASKLELTDFYSALENTFKMSIMPADCENFKTVSDVINFVVDHAGFT